ncbi:MAG TPA: hypothetical protein VHJ19_11610 [Gammaproteobacteria bacterium]|nr:hypothetical protein [Gammaproteobacteria bacterium]
MREAPRKDFRIVILVSSGMRVEVLDEKRGCSLIKAQELRGWVRTRDLMRIPSASALLAAAEQQFAEGGWRWTRPNRR